MNQVLMIVMAAGALSMTEMICLAPVPALWAEQTGTKLEIRQ